MKRDPNKKYLLAVSGGVDSMVMLYTFIANMPTENFAVVTVNHNLRAEGAFDCNFVKQYCTENGVTCFVKSVDVKGYALASGQSIETAARQLRYKAINDVADTYGYDVVCLAHHADDNAETVLLHITRGGGLRGATGMKRLQGRYFRPLLKMSKEEIVNFAHANQIPYVEDKTNADVAYKRNLVRHEVLPALTQINPYAVRALNSFAALAEQEDDYLDSLADVSFVTIENGVASLPVSRFNEFHPVLKARIIRKTMRALGYYKDIEQSHVAMVINLCKTTDGEQSVDLPFSLAARRSYDLLTIYEKRETTHTGDCKIPFVEGEFDFLGQRIVVSDKPPKNDFFLMADKDKFPSDCVIRTRKEGDVFAKFGSGEKKLKDYLIDIKYPQHLRDRLPVVASGKNVYAVFGVQIGEKVKVSPDTENKIYLYVSSSDDVR